MRLIDADEIPRVTWIEGVTEVIDIGWIDDAPTVDAAPIIHGKWELEHGTYGKMQCSVCKKECPLEKSMKPDGWREELLYIASDYCPWCGAKMDGGNENE